jgi:hypothetical protein
MRPPASKGTTIMGIIMIMPITATPTTTPTMVRTENTIAIERGPGSQATMPFAKVQALLDYVTRDTYSPRGCSPPATRQYAATF